MGTDARIAIVSSTAEDEKRQEEAEVGQMSNETMPTDAAIAFMDLERVPSASLTSVESEKDSPTIKYCVKAAKYRSASPISTWFLEPPD